MNFTHGLLIVFIIAKYTAILGGGFCTLAGFLWGYFSVDELSWVFARIPRQNPFYLSCFLFANSILHVEMIRRKFSVFFDLQEIFPWKKGFPE